MNSKTTQAITRDTNKDVLSPTMRTIVCVKKAAYFATTMKTGLGASVSGEGNDEDDGLALVDVTDPESPEFQKLWLLYNTAFPQDERRSLFEHKLIQEDQRFHFAAIRYEGLTAGFLAYWELHDLLFIEHFAIEPEFRSEGIGSRVIEDLQYEADRMIVLDVEPEDESVNAVRRVHFYEKHGFRYCRKPVVLPTYWSAKPIPSNLMVWAPNNSKLTQKQILDSISRGIYHINVVHKNLRRSV